MACCCGNVCCPDKRPLVVNVSGFSAAVTPPSEPTRTYSFSEMNATYETNNWNNYGTEGCDKNALQLNYTRAYREADDNFGGITNPTGVTININFQMFFSLVQVASDCTGARDRQPQVTYSVLKQYFTSFGFRFASCQITGEGISSCQQDSVCQGLYGRSVSGMSQINEGVLYGTVDCSLS
jgi:hypothetical protein